MKIAQTLKFHFEHKSNVSPGEKEKGSRGREGERDYLHVRLTSQNDSVKPFTLLSSVVSHTHIHGIHVLS